MLIPKSADRMTMKFANTFVLTGPTGAGKSELGLQLAEYLGAEILSMDSMALYRGMDIGTAKPTAEDRRRVPHHLVDVLEPWESSSVAWWLERANDCRQAIQSRGRKVLIVGGTLLYLKALLHGLFDGPPGDPALRERLSREAESAGQAMLHARLAEIDPLAAARLHPNDARRVIRALEVWELTGRPISSWQGQWKETPALPEAWSPQVYRLDLPRAELYDRIDARVQQMFAKGLVEEVRGLRDSPQPMSREAQQALGYKEVLEHLEGAATLESTVARIQTRSRNYAKRQLTWFRNLPECRPVNRQLTFASWGLTIG